MSFVTEDLPPATTPEQWRERYTATQTSRLLELVEASLVDASAPEQAASVTVLVDGDYTVTVCDNVKRAYLDVGWSDVLFELHENGNELNVELFFPVGDVGEGE